jgi:23S rRNA (adenine2503-C2)-methyltransferase
MFYSKEWSKPLKKFDIKSMTYSEMNEALKTLSLPHYRIEQIYAWLQKYGAESYEEMHNLPKELREKLASNYPILNCRIMNKQTSQKDDTVKYLFSLSDGALVESVVMKYKYGYTICVSTQIGCRMGCNFCATAESGLVRNLFPSEILAQIHTAQRDLNVRVSHVVLMGMGEPLDNYLNVLRFLDLVSSQDGLNIGMRNVSLSTCGIIPAIYMLLEKKYQLTLSVSLHAPSNEIRNSIMPVNKKYPLEELLKACKKYANETSRRISFEYVMLKGVNDSENCAIQLSGILRGILCHVNLIPANNVDDCEYTKSDLKTIECFEKVLCDRGINTTVRRSLGSDIDASCGQLRRRNIGL